MEKRVKDETGEPMVAQSKMDEATVSELEVKGIERPYPNGKETPALATCPR